jgi:hypothetical protein
MNSRLPIPRAAIGAALAASLTQTATPTDAPPFRQTADGDLRGFLKEQEIPAPGNEVSAFMLDAPGSGASVIVELTERLDPGRNEPAAPKPYSANLHLVVRLYAHVRGVRTLIDQGRVFLPDTSFTAPKFQIAEQIAAATVPAERYEVTVQTLAPSGMRGTMRIGARVAESGIVERGGSGWIEYGPVPIATLDPATGGHFVALTPDEKPIWIDEIVVADTLGLLPADAVFAVFPAQQPIGQVRPYHRDLLGAVAGAPSSRRWRWDGNGRGLYCARGAYLVLNPLAGGVNAGADPGDFGVSVLVRYR